MPIDSVIRDGAGHKYVAGVTSNNALQVTLVDVPLIDVSVEELTRKKQYRDWLKTLAGSSAMNVVGSLATPVVFEETADDSRVRWITSWRLLLESTYMELDTNDFRRFGPAATAPGLTNGLKFYFIQGGISTNVFLLPVKNIGRFLDYADGYTNLTNAVSSQEDYLSFDFSFDVPVVLAAGSSDKIIMEVRDDLSALTRAQVIVRGYQEVI